MTLVGHMAEALGLPEKYLLAVAASASHKYKAFVIPKRGGGNRSVHQPSGKLKPIQRWLQRRHIERWPVHRAVTSYRRGLSIVDNARAHQNSDYLLRMDISDFFGSIRRRDIESFVQTVEPEWNDADTEFFCRLVCRNDVLVIGAPSSPSLSNAICHELDIRLTEASEQKEVKYTRYADDLFFSSNLKGVLAPFETTVIQVLGSLPIPGALSINLQKTRHSSRRGRRRVTGLTLNSDRSVGVGRELKRKVRSMIHKLNRLTAKERKQLAGYIAYIKGIDSGFINSLILKYDPDTVHQARFPPHQDR